MKVILLLAPVALLMLGCASSPQPMAAAPAAAGQAPVAAEDTTLSAQTGSRLLRRSTDRTLRVVGNQAFKDDNEIRTLGNSVGIKGN